MLILLGVRTGCSRENYMCKKIPFSEPFYQSRRNALELQDSMLQEQDCIIITCNQGRLLQCMTTLYTEPKEAIELRRIFFLKMMFLFVAGKVGSLWGYRLIRPGGRTYKHCLGPRKGDRNGAWAAAANHILYYGVPFLSGLYGHRRRHRVPKRRYAAAFRPLCFTLKSEGASPVSTSRHVWQKLQCCLAVMSTFCPKKTDLTRDWGKIYLTFEFTTNQAFISF